MFGGFELSARQGVDSESESAVRSAGGAYAYFSSVPRDVSWGFQTFAVVSDRKPGERRGAFGNRVLCAEPRAGGCALAGPAVRCSHAGAAAASVSDTRQRVQRSEGLFRVESGCCATAHQWPPSAKPASSSVWYSVSGLLPNT